MNNWLPSVCIYKQKGAIFRCGKRIYDEKSLSLSSEFTEIYMKSTLLSTFLACALFGASQAQAQQFVNLTPVPMQMRVDKGTYRLPAQFTIGGAQLPDSIKAEAQKFVTDFNKSATGATASFSKKAEGVALELVHDRSLYKTLGQEGYKLAVTATGIRLESATTTGFFYGLTRL